MSRVGFHMGLNQDISDGGGRDDIAGHVMSGKLRAAYEARDRELDEKIRMGWGNTETRNIPSDWRERRGPDSEERRLRMQRNGARIAFRRARAANPRRIRERVNPAIIDAWKRRRRAMKQAQTGT